MSSTDQSTFRSYAQGQNRTNNTTNYTASSQATSFSQQSTTSNNQASYSAQGSASNNTARPYQIEGRAQELAGDKEGFLKWASGLNNEVVISGSSDYSKLSNLKDAIFELKGQYFNPNSGLSVSG